MIGLKCPKCKAIMKIDESMVGTEATCPGCQGKFRVPSLPSRGPNPPASTPAEKTNPQTRSGPQKQTGIQPKATKPPADPAIRPSRTAPISPSPPEEEDFEYTVEDIDDPEVPAPPPRKRIRVEIEDDEADAAVEVDEEEDDSDDEEEADEDQEEEEVEEEDEERPSKKRKKKKDSEGRLVLPIVAGSSIFVVVLLCTGVGYYLFNRKGSAPDPAKAMEMIQKRGGKFKQDENDPEKPVIEVTLMGTDADNGDLMMLRAFPKLRKLDVSNCTKINNPGLEWLVELKELRILNFNFCSHVSDGGMEHIGKITSLEELYLNQTIVTDRGLADLKGLKKLKKLGLSGALASGLGLQGAIPGLEIIK